MVKYPVGLDWNHLILGEINESQIYFSKIKNVHYKNAIAVKKMLIMQGDKNCSTIA